MLSINTFIEGNPQKITAAVTLSFFSWVFFISPNAFAINEELSKVEKRQAAIEAALDKTPEKAFVRRLQLLKEQLALDIPRQKQQAKKLEKEKTLGEARQFLQQYGLFLPPVLTNEQRTEITRLRDEINALAAEANKGFTDVAEHITNKDLPKVALERHQQATAQVETRFNGFNEKVNALLNAKERKAEKKALDVLTQFIELQQFSKGHNKTNLDSMPFGAAKSEVRKPKQNSVALQEYLQIPFTKLASLNSVGLLENTKVPAAADLEENIEIQLTPAIKAKAAELNHNPVEIYTWVHNSVEFIPSFGSIQGADYTLQSLKGNSFDTASLLIALLRASNIPARYAYGTIDIPIEKMNNWVGGVDNIYAASNLLGQGGVPSTLMRMNGVDQSVRMEHVWVEAFVDFEPSRGVNNIEGDNWIPMDASYKQYDFSEGMDIENNVAFDTDALVQSINNNTTINEAEGWVQNIPQADVETQLQQFQTQIEEYINTQNPDATLGEVLGLQEIKIKPAQPLSAGLPYQLITAKQSFSEIPAHLRHTFSYSLNTVGYAGSTGSPFFTINKTLPELAGKKLALSYKPSTADDEAIILSYIPDVPEGQELDPSQLPSSLPGYIINMTAQFTIDGETVAEAPAGTMGTELRDQFQLRSPTGEQFPATGNYITVGQYHAIGVDFQGISATQLQNLQQDMEATKAKLEAADTDPTQLDSLTKHDVVGDLLQATIQSYFALNDLQDKLLTQSAKASSFRMPSYGKFSTNLNTVYSWGVPRNVEFDGMMMDMDFMRVALGTNEQNPERQKQLMKQMGMRLSAMEHLVPEQMFSTEESPAYGVSAVKAIQLAAAEGQKIYTITQANVNAALSAINLNSATEQEIRNAVYAGKEVTTHTHRINYQGMITAGYTILDPETGAGAYKIASGEDGALMAMAGFALIIMELLIIGFSITMGPAMHLFLISPAGQQLILSVLFSALSMIATGISTMLRALEDEDAPEHEGAAAGALCGVGWGLASGAIGALLGSKFPKLPFLSLPLAILGSYYGYVAC